jgi:23S rRNA (pseudouridine1915-N3)-methyltransferase
MRIEKALRKRGAGVPGLFNGDFVAHFGGWAFGGGGCGGCGILLVMQLTLAHVGSGSGAKDGYEAPIQGYLERCVGFAQCRTEGFRSEKALMDWLGRQRGRTGAFAVLLDGRGRAMTSEALAAWIGTRRDEGTQHLVFAIGPADGWSEEARAGARLLLSLGPMTLAHALARLVMAEQIYRAVTILAGHPYHRQ